MGWGQGTETLAVSVNSRPVSHGTSLCTGGRSFSNTDFPGVPQPVLAGVPEPSARSSSAGRCGGGVLGPPRSPEQRQSFPAGWLRLLHRWPRGRLGWVWGSGERSPPSDTSVHRLHLPSLLYLISVRVLQGSWTRGRPCIQLYCYLSCNKAVWREGPPCGCCFSLRAVYAGLCRAFPSQRIQESSGSPRAPPPPALQPHPGHSGHLSPPRFHPQAAPALQLGMPSALSPRAPAPGRHL